MLIAGEGAGSWATGNGLPFPYIIQEAEITEKFIPVWQDRISFAGA
jgi:hypothetical protein